jgi:ADP-heptose:LPS heptosyltransferase/lauroyl/myristoyl acyltransferase
MLPMLTGLIIKSTGFIFSLLPYSLLESVVDLFGFVFVSFPSRRRRLLFSNLKHAFPDWNHAQVKRAGRLSSARMLEMGFFSLTYPFLSKAKRRRTIKYSQEVEGQLDEYRKSGKPLLILLPHLCLFETLATSPYFRPQGGKSLGAIYRPNTNPTLDRWINCARSKMGLRTFARKSGLLKARDHLRNGNWLVVLFDQNAGLKGERSFFLDRLCSISPLPDLLGKTAGCKVVYAMARRIDFFKTTLELRELPEDCKAISSEAHEVLGEDIRRCPDGLPEWLWSHGKWKTNDASHEIFHLEEKNELQNSKFITPRKTKIWIRMPNWLGDIVMAIPLIRAVRAGRPDAHVTLLCLKQYKPLLESLDLGDCVDGLPDKGVTYFFRFWKRRHDYPSVHFLFTNSLRGDLEAYVIGAPLRLGGSRGKKRPLLTHLANAPKASGEIHQVSLWEKYLKSFGLRKEVDLSPLTGFGQSKTKDKVICLAPGSSNSPEKRWPIEEWVRLLESLLVELPEYTFRLIGSVQDTVICGIVQERIGSAKVKDESGKTNLIELCGKLAESRVLICNDSGAMHLANALGTPVAAIFGPTAPSVTGPIFQSPSAIIRSDSTNTMDSIESEVVLQSALSLLK